MNDKKLERGRNKNHNQNATVEIDYERYQEILDDPDMSESDKRQIIEALWQIIVQFVDLGIGVHPMQQADNASQDKQNSNTVSLEKMFDLAGTENTSKGVDA